MISDFKIFTIMLSRRLNFGVLSVWIGLDWNTLFRVDKIVEKKIKFINA